MMNNRREGKKQQPPLGAPHSEKTVPFQTLLNTPNRVVAIYLSNRCNIVCRHCGVNTGPWEHERLDIAQFLQEFPIAVRLYGVQAIHVSGGEPFLFPRILQELGALTQRCGSLLAVNSNGFWAKSVTRAESLLDSLSFQ
jgi:MoaA/NifB/PqqE/SkfB family radical SAM enzyme